MMHRASLSPLVAASWSAACSSASSSVAPVVAVRALTTSCALQRSAPRLPLRSTERTIRWVSPPSFNGLFKKFVLQVHPDTFGDSPAQQAVNQESLQQLNAFVSTLKTRDGAGVASGYPERQSLKLAFYLKKRVGDKEFFAHSVQEGAHLLDRSAHRSNGLARKKLMEGEQIVAQYKARMAKAAGIDAITQANAAAASAPSRGDVLPNEFHILPVVLRTTGSLCKHSLAAQFRSVFRRAGLPGANAEFEWDPEYWKVGPKEFAAKAEAQAKEQQPKAE